MRGFGDGLDDPGALGSLELGAQLASVLRIGPPPVVAFYLADLTPIQRYIPGERRGACPTALQAGHIYAASRKSDKVLNSGRDVRSRGQRTSPKHRM